MPVWMMAPLKVSRSTMAAQSRGSVNVFVHPTGAETLVRSDRDAVLLLPLGQNLKQQLSAPAVKLHIAEFINLCGYRNRSTYAEDATMPRASRVMVSFG